MAIEIPTWHPRLDKSDSLAVILRKLSDEQVDAATIVADILRHGEQHAGVTGSLLSLTVVLHLDELGFYGKAIVALHESVGESDIGLTKTVLDASHSKLITREQVVAAMEGHEPLDLEALRAELDRKTLGFNSLLHSPVPCLAKKQLAVSAA